MVLYLEGKHWELGHFRKCYWLKVNYKMISFLCIDCERVSQCFHIFYLEGKRCPDLMGKPRGSGWRGRWEAGSGWGTHVNPWLFHSSVWQNSLQIKKKKKEGKRCPDLSSPDPPTSVSSPLTLTLVSPIFLSDQSSEQSSRLSSVSRCVCMLGHSADPVARQAPLCGVFQARIVELLAMSYSRGSSWIGDRTCVSCAGRQILHHCHLGRPQSLAPLQKTASGPSRDGGHKSEAFSSSTILC